MVAIVLFNYEGKNCFPCKFFEDNSVQMIGGNDQKRTRQIIKHNFNPV